jgi:hypothetical protein
MKTTHTPDRLAQHRSLRRVSKLSLLTLALTSPMTAVWAQGNEDLLQELRSLKARIEQIESVLKTPPTSSATEQAQEFDRIRVKVEAVEDNAESFGFKGLKISGMMDPTFLYNRAQHSSGFVFLNNFDGAGRTTGSLTGAGGSDSYAYDNSYFGMAVLDLQKETEDAQRWRLTLAPHKSASSGFNIGSIVHEASVSIPVDGPRTRLIAGQLPDWTGYEYFFSNLQPLITHNLLFDFTIPSYYSGAGMEFTSGKWISKFILGNVDQTRVPDYKQPGHSRLPGLSFRVDYAKGEFEGFGFAGSHTPGQDKQVTQGEVDAYFIRGPLSLQGQVGAGQAKSFAANGGTAAWTGFSGLVGYKFTPRWQLTARFDYILNDKNGGGLWGAPVNSSDLTATNYATDGRNGIGLPRVYNGVDWVPQGTKGVNRYALSLGSTYLISPSHTPNSGLWNTGTWLKTSSALTAPTGRYFRT